MTEPYFDDEPNPIADHFEHMLRTYGSPDPPCFWCGIPVVRAWTDWDGVWSTIGSAMGPVPDDDLERVDGTACPESPYHQHDLVGPA